MGGVLPDAWTNALSISSLTERFLSIMFSFDRPYIVPDRAENAQIQRLPREICGRLADKHYFRLQFSLSTLRPSRREATAPYRAQIWHSASKAPEEGAHVSRRSNTQGRDGVLLIVRHLCHRPTTPHVFRYVFQVQNIFDSL